MFDQLDDARHEITLRNISRRGLEAIPGSSGVLNWTPNAGITYSIRADQPLVDETDSSNSQHVHVGRLSELDLSTPNWIARTDDNTDVRIYEGIESSSRFWERSNTSARRPEWKIDGKQAVVVVDIPTRRMLAFDNSTEEDYRLFFLGSAGMKLPLHKQVRFLDVDGTEYTNTRSSVVLTQSPRISLVACHPLVKCQPSGWIAYERAPTASDVEASGFEEQNFVSFLNGVRVPFPWADRRLSSDIIRRTYFGWVRSSTSRNSTPIHQTLPFLGGAFGLRHSDDVILELPSFFCQFRDMSRRFDFAMALHPLWAALDGVLQDQLALVSVSLERIASYWKECRRELAPHRQVSVWENRAFLKSLRKCLQNRLDELLGSNRARKVFQSSLIRGLIDRLNSFIDSNTFDGISPQDLEELREVMMKRINNTQIPNSTRLRQPFQDVGMQLSAKEDEALRIRNGALHGKGDGAGTPLDKLDKSVEYFDHNRMLITKFVLRLCKYKGPYIDYASRPTSGGSLEVRKLEY